MVNTATTATLGVLFLLLSVATTLLMYYLWGFPFHKETRTSEAPRWLLRTHRIMGYTYAAIYVVMMTQMVPRMWQYQVEFPPRTVAHLLFGYLIGILLLLKIVILRFFRHFEESMPYVGTALLICSLLLGGLSLPFAYRESALAHSAVGGDAFGLQNRRRVGELLPEGHFPADAPLSELSSVNSLQAGRAVLLQKCVTCHDLRTVLERPRTPEDWVETVSRMAEKPTLSAPIPREDQWHVSAYLIAITPDLQRSLKEKQRSLREKRNAMAAPTPVAPPLTGSERAPNGSPPGADRQIAETTFRQVCSQCHALSEVDNAPPKTAADVTALLARMVKNGMRADPHQTTLIRDYLISKYTK